jgi:hypothetical protein
LGYGGLIRAQPDVRMRLIVLSRFRGRAETQKTFIRECWRRQRQPGDEAKRRHKRHGCDHTLVPSDRRLLDQEPSKPQEVFLRAIGEGSRIAAVLNPKRFSIGLSARPVSSLRRPFVPRSEPAEWGDGPSFAATDLGHAFAPKALLAPRPQRRFDRWQSSARCTSQGRTNRGV